MLFNNKKKSQSSFLGAVKSILDFRLPTIWYAIRNYQITISEQSIRHGAVFKRTQWRLCNPLKIEYEKKVSNALCDDCNVHGCLYGNDVYHANKWRYFNRYIWSNRLNYHYTSTTCEDRLFEPLDLYYSSGGEDGSAICAGSNCGTGPHNERTGKRLKRIVNVCGVYYE